jgi:hypothetical protein
MRLGRMMLAVVGAALLLATVVSAASARNLSTSSQAMRTSFARFDFSGGFGTLECEVVIEGSFHSRTTTKTVGTLVGYVTAGNITRCARGGGTIDRETLPWHVRYAGFGGTLPNIVTIFANTSGLSFRVREPTFGITCQVTGATSTVSLVRTTATGATASATVSGTAPCSGIDGTLSSSTTSVDNRAGARITVTLI